MNKKFLPWIVVLGVLAILVMWGVGRYNSIITAEENVETAWSQVENQYQRRMDLIPNLVETVKGYAAHESETLENVVAARAKATQIVIDPTQATPEQLARVREYMEEKGYEYFDICAPICEGTKELTNRVAAVLSTLPPILTFEADPVPVEELISSKERFTVTEENGVYVVEAEFLKKIMATINPEDYESLQYFQRVLHTSGIIQALIDAGCGDGDTVRIYDIEFDYVS